MHVQLRGCSNVHMNPIVMHQGGSMLTCACAELVMPFNTRHFDRVFFGVWFRALLDGKNGSRSAGVVQVPMDMECNSHIYICYYYII